MTRRKDKKNNPYVTNIHPVWLDNSKNFEYWDDELSEIVQFFVINSICSKQSYRNYNLTDNYKWKKGCWRDKKYLKNDLDKILFYGNPNKLLLVDSYKDLEKAFKDNNLEDDFYKDLNPRCSLFISNKSGCKNKYMSMFYHVRNSLAHGRFIIENNDEEQFIVMEDGKIIDKKFKVNFRLVVSKKSLVEVIKHLKKGPKKEINYEDVFMDLIQSGICTKGKICNELNLDKNNSIWIHTIGMLKNKNFIKYENKRWNIVG